MRQPNPLAVIDAVQKAYAEEQKARDAFWSVTHEDVKAEFINGVGYVHNSPVYGHHAFILEELMYQVSHWRRQAPGTGRIGFEKDCIRLERGDFEPDFVYWNQETAKKITSKNVFRPVPQLVAEILSKSTKKRDRVEKFESYALGGIEEYWIIDPVKKTIEQYENRAGQYLLIARGSSGILTTPILPGFELDLDKLFDYK